MDSKKDTKFLYIDLKKRTQTLSPIGFQQENIYQASTMDNHNRTKFVSVDYINNCYLNNSGLTLADLVRELTE